MIIGWIFGILIGLVVGIVLMTFVYFGRTAFGTLLIDQKHFEKDVYRFDIGGDIVKLPKKKRVIWKVNPNADLRDDF